MLDITKKFIKWNTKVRSMTSVVDIVERVKNLKGKMGGSTARRMDERQLKEVLEWYPRDCTGVKVARKKCEVKWMRVA